MFTRIGAAAYKADLHNTLALLAALDHPHRRFKSIHVAGTNGKGSVSHMMAAILQAHGYRTGLYTSPHLIDFRERIRLNGEWIPASFVVDFTNRIRPVIEEISPSFFEVTVAMAFEWFAQQQVDIAVIETGLGGRLDSTNVITPELSIITNIGLDHVQLLGHTLAAIASEKAGIIKPGIPVVLGEQTAETAPVFAAKAASGHSALHIAPLLWHIQQVVPAAHALQLSLVASHHPQQQVTLRTDLPGLYQQYNVRTVYCACQQLQARGWPLQPELIAAGLQQVKRSTGLQGRWELVQRQPDVVLDVAHNEHGMRQVLAQLQWMHQQQPGLQVHVVMGMVKDKDIDAVLQLLPAGYRYYFTQAQLPRALPATELQLQAATHGLQGPAYLHVNEALHAALQVAAPTDCVLVCGSVFVVGEVDRTAFRMNEESQI